MAKLRFSVRKVRGVLCAGLIVIVVLGACRGQPTPAPESPAAGPEATSEVVNTPHAGATSPPAPLAAATLVTPPVARPTNAVVAGTVALWHSWAGAEGDALATVLTRMKSTMPGVTVQTLYVAPNELTAAYVDAAQRGGGPDLVIIPNWYLAGIVDAQAARPLDDLIPEAVREVYLPATVDSLTIGGALYGLPISYSLVALYVNTALVPGREVAGTTAALLGQAESAPEAGIGIYASLLHVVWGIPAFGGEFLDAQAQAVLDQTDGAAAFLEWLIAVDHTPGSYVDQDYGMLLDRFSKGEFAYFVDGPWASTQLLSALGDELMVVPLPAGPAGPARPWLYADGVLVSPSTPDDRLPVAIMVAQALTSADAGTELASTGGLLPAAAGAVLAGDPLLQGFAGQAQTAAVMPIGPGMREVWAYGGDMIIKALAGVDTPEKIAAETAALINEAIAP